MRSLIFINLILLSLSSCDPYKKTSLSNEVFLSHRIFKQNYQKYVYLVHDGDSTYLLDRVSVDYLNGSDTVLNGADTVATISGIIRPLDTPKDSNDVLSGRGYSKDNTRNVEIFLTKKKDREIWKYERLNIKEKDIQKVRMQKIRGESSSNLLVRVFLIIVGVFVVVFGSFVIFIIYFTE